MMMTAIKTPPGASALLSWYASLHATAAAEHLCTVASCQVSSQAFTNLDHRHSVLPAFAAVCARMQTNQLSFDLVHLLLDTNFLLDTTFLFAGSNCVWVCMLETHHKTILMGSIP